MPPRVLIVDDNAILAENLGELLELEGFEPVVFSSSREALERAPQLRFEAALLDIRMPEVDGIELCAALAGTHPHARLVLMTAFTLETRLAQADAAGAAAVLPKPVPMHRLLDLLSAGQAVLIVEDDDRMRSELRAGLEEHGYRTLTASTLAEAKEQLQRGVPRFAALELLLPDGRADEIIPELVAAGAHVVLIGGGAEAPAADRVQYVSKPFRPADLVSLLGQLASSSAQR